MTDKNLNTLPKEYPLAFSGRIDRLYPFPMFGFECGDGWYDLILPVIQYLHEYNSAVPEEGRIAVSQVKEKYGTLRFYTHGYTDELDTLIDAAEAASEVTCEQCGAPGKIRGKGWYYTACDAHVKTK